MAIIQLPQQQTFGTGFGAGLGSSIGSGIQSLVNMKLDALAKRQKQQSTMQGLQALGYTQEESAQLSALDPQILNTVVKEKIQEPSQRFYQSVISGAPIGKEAPRVATTPIAKSIEKPAYTLQEPSMDSLPMPKNKVDYASGLSNEIDRYKSALSSGRLKTKQADQLSKLIAQKENTLSKLIINDKKEAATERRFNKKLDIQKQEKIDKEYKPIVKKINSKAEAALTDRARFKEMKRINEEGDLGSNAFNIFVDALEHGIFGLGVNLTSLQSADAQSLKKLSKDFVKNVKETIGTSRITQAEVMLYLSTIPNLMQSPEGRARIIDTNIALGNLQVKKADITHDIIKKNKGDIPKNFDSILLQRMKPHIQKFENKILQVAKAAKENKKLKKKQKAFEAITGEKVGTFAGAVPGALAGAKLGSIGGPIGAGAGLILGGLGGAVAGGKLGDALSMLQNPGNPYNYLR